MDLRLSVPRTLTDISPAAEAVTAIMGGWTDDARQSVDLALVEALTNIVRHGPADPRPVALEVEVGDGHVTIDIRDLAPPIPPDLLSSVDPSVLEAGGADIDRIPEGGRGLALILVLMDEVSLHQDGGQDGELSRLRLVLRR